MPRRHLMMRKGDAKILVVDDESSIRNMLRDIFTEAGYQVALAENGKKALKIIEKETSIALVLLDIKMPRMDGFQLIKEIKRRDLHVKIIIMTGHGIKWRIDAFLEGADYCIAKPFHVSDVLDAVETTIG